MTIYTNAKSPCTTSALRLDIKINPPENRKAGLVSIIDLIISTLQKEKLHDEIVVFFVNYNNPTKMTTSYFNTISTV